jgi:hypothetical protein
LFSDSTKKKLILAFQRKNHTALLQLQQIRKYRRKSKNKVGKKSRQFQKNAQGNADVDCENIINQMLKATETMIAKISQNKCLR